ncbi:MAG: ABC transporter permease subunit [Flavobacteriaceae bacterium]|nr:ABC transporter permease subunit [Flavobacteriaceae bacterium]MCY4161193.1 ABC transporter permease subunit [Flavobacteriaceae bacterium]MCY4253379.1 ABC transporter permease subunit [Flavobacteriaceae bacterium]
MIRLIQIELYKLYYNRFARFLLISYFLLILSAVLLTSIKVDLNFIKFYLAEQGIFNFPYIWHFNTYVIALLKIFLAIVVIFMISNEFVYKTLKQNLIDGLTKREVLNSKFLTLILFVLVSTVFVFFVTFFLGLIYSDYNELAIIMTDIEYMIPYAVKLLGFFSICMFLVFLVKRATIAIGMLGSWTALEPIIKAILDVRLKDTFLINANDIAQFFPLQSMSNLIVEPFTRFSVVRNLAHQAGSPINKSYDITLQSIVIVLVWTVIFYFWSYYLLKKRDL